MSRPPAPQRSLAALMLALLLATISAATAKPYTCGNRGEVPCAGMAGAIPVATAEASRSFCREFS